MNRHIINNVIGSVPMSATKLPMVNGRLQGRDLRHDEPRSIIVCDDRL